MAVGIDSNRVSLLLAVLEKRAGLNLAGDDVYVNVAGGMSIEEPAADLSVVAAVASSVRNRSLPASTAMFGEVGLSGEIRGIPQAAVRVREAIQMGFDRIVMPAANVELPELAAGGATFVGVRTVGEALDHLIT
jgi:DNA repair protein RadA/Sms